MIDAGLPSITDLSSLEPQFGARVAALLAASGGQLRVVSAHRTPEQQQTLWDTAAAQFGPNAADKWVAQPGHSNHEQGLAVDFAGNLALAHKLAPQFGLVAPMGWEDQHFEPVGAQGNPNAYTAPPPGFPSPASPAAQTSTQQHLAAISAALGHLDPQDRQAVQAAQAGAPVSGGGPPGLSPEDQAPSAPGGAPAASAASPVAAPTAPPPVVPQQSTAGVIASPGTQGDTQALLQGQPLTQAATADTANAAAGAAGVLGNPTGTGHIQTTPQRVSFAKGLIAQLNSQGLNIPDTPENERALVAWQQGEGTSAAFNPLATTDHAPGSTAFNSNNGDPVQNFTSFEQGLETTARTLTNGRYGNILAALQQGSSAVAVAQAIKASPWGTGALVLKILEGA